MFKRRGRIESPSTDYRRSRETTGQKRIPARCLSSTKYVLNSRYSRRRVWFRPRLCTSSYGIIVIDSVGNRKMCDVDANDCDSVQCSVDVK